MSYRKQRRKLEREFRRWDRQQNVSKDRIGKNPSKIAGFIGIFLLIMVIAFGLGILGGWIRFMRIQNGGEVSTTGGYTYVDRFLPNGQDDFEWSGDYTYLRTDDTYLCVVSAYEDYVQIKFEDIPQALLGYALENVTIEIKMSGMFSHLHFAFDFTANYRYDINEDYPTPWGHVMSNGNNQILTTTLDYSGLGYDCGNFNDAFLRVWSIEGIYLTNPPSSIDYINIISVGYSIQS